MKANRKFVEGNEEGVSAVIGVILMVAITVAIAATVYVYVSGMIGGTPEKTPEIQFIKDETNDRLTVAKTDGEIRWYDLSIRCSADGYCEINADARIYMGGGFLPFPSLRGPVRDLRRPDAFHHDGRAHLHHREGDAADRLYVGLR